MKKISKKSAGAKGGNKLPSAKNTPKYKTSWDFSDLYSGPSDPKLAKDTELIKKAYADFAYKYSKSTSYLKSETELLLALKDYELMCDKAGTWKPVWYLSHLQSIDSQNPVVSASMNKLEAILIEAGNQILFFELNLAKIPTDFQSKLLKDSKFTKFKYFLENIFKSAKHDLPEEVEKVMSLKSTTSRSMWVDGFEKQLSKQSIKFKGESLPISSALSQIHQLPTNDRRRLQKLCMEKLKSISDFCEAEINAVCTDKKINDQLRGYTKPYEATVLRYENNLKNIELLVKTVTDNFKISHRFYNLKAKALGLKTLTYADRAVGIGKAQKKVSFDHGIEILRSSFSKAGNHYVEILENMLQKGRIDVYPKTGKRGGAYCSSGLNVPTIVLLNQIDVVDNVMTFAHEMGHAIHSELAKTQPPIYMSYSTSTAEVASTFFENLAFDEIFESLSDKEKVIALYDRTADYIQTIFRQIACFNFELELNNEIRQKGFLSAEEIAKIHNKHMSAYMGPITRFDVEDGYFFVTWSHIRNHFYVYSYAYGALVSRALYEKCKVDKTFYAKVDSFMKAGKSMSPEDIFKSIGVDVTDPGFYLAGLKSIEKDIEKLEKLLKKSSK